jgi:hypothetical protein
MVKFALPWESNQNRCPKDREMNMRKFSFRIFHLMLPFIAMLLTLMPQPVWPQEPKPPLYSDLSQTYGYYRGQKLSIELIQKKFPSLSVSASHAQMAFDLVFKSSYENIEKELRNLLRQQWPKYRRQMHQNLTSNVGSASISMTQARTFIRTVRLRAKGQIDPPILETLLTYNPEFQNNPAKEFLRGFKSTYRTKRHPKAKGVDFQIEYPKSWRAKEGNRPNVIQFFNSKNGRGLESILLMVKNISLPLGYKITERELDDFFSPQELKVMVPKGASFISAQPVVLDNQKGGMMIFDQTLQRVDQKVSIRNLHFITIYKNKMIFIQCMVAAKTGNQDDLKKQFRRLVPLFKLVANSFVIQSQY